MNIGINRNKPIFDNDCTSLDFMNDSNDQHFGFTIEEKIFNNILQEPKNISGNKIKYFKIIKVKRVGRKRKRVDPKFGKIHSKYDFDNIIRKIQVHFHKFLISFVNEILMGFGIKQKFLNTDYKNKRNVKKEIVDNLKSKEIGKILCQTLSTKYKKLYKLDKEKNSKLYSEVIENVSIKKILSEPYINIFRNFYYKNKRDLNDYNLNIQLSNKVKTYQDLLNDCNKDSGFSEKIENIVKKCYLPKKIFIKN